MSPATWIIVGATRGIGLEFVRQLLCRGERVIATVRSTSQASQLWTLTAGAAAPRVGSWCRMLECDVTVDESINVCFLFFFVSSSVVRPSPEGGRRLSSLLSFLKCKLPRISCIGVVILSFSLWLSGLCAHFRDLWKM